MRIHLVESKDRERSSFLKGVFGHKLKNILDYTNDERIIICIENVVLHHIDSCVPSKKETWCG